LACKRLQRTFGLAAFSSGAGGILSLFIFLLATPALSKIAASFGPHEYFALTLSALSMLPPSADDPASVT
jgi:TctA family transporter